MEKLMAILTELLFVQRSALAIGEQLVQVFDEEESLDQVGFSVAAVHAVVARKDALIHRLVGAEQKRRSLAGTLGFLISLDMRGSAPTLSHIVASLKVYGENVRKVLDEETLQKVSRAIEIYCSETSHQIEKFGHFHRRIERNQRIVTRLRDSIQRSARYFEQACSSLDTSYDKGGKLRPDSSRLRRHTQVAVKA